MFATLRTLIPQAINSNFPLVTVLSTAVHYPRNITSCPLQDYYNHVPL